MIQVPWSRAPEWLLGPSRITTYAPPQSDERPVWGMHLWPHGAQADELRSNVYPKIYVGIRPEKGTPVVRRGRKATELRVSWPSCRRIDRSVPHLEGEPKCYPKRCTAPIASLRCS